MSDVVTISVDGERFKYWSELSLVDSVDNYSTFNFSCPFSVGNLRLSEVFPPYSYKRAEVHIDDDLIFTGTVVNSPPALTAKSKSIHVSGYSLPGVFQDCTAPISAYPIEFNEATLTTITKRLASYFGFGVVAEKGTGAVFSTVALETAKKIQPFIVDLAVQRNRVLSNTALGDIEFLEPDHSGEPVAMLEQGKPPVTDVQPSFNGQAYYSEISGLQPTLVGIPGAQHSAKNPFLTGILRPFVFKTPDAQELDASTATTAKMSRMFAETISYEVYVPTWRNSKGELWKRGDFISVLAPDAYISKPFLFLIRSVTRKAAGSERTAVLTLVLPTVFSGMLPEALPWA